MLEIEKIKDYLKEVLSEKRYTHSLGVAEEAVKLAKHYYVDYDKAYIAGLVHDCPKEIDNTTAKKMLSEKYNITIDPITLNTHKLLHGPLGACIAQDEFAVYDAEILDAIKYHTTAKSNMSMLTQIIYIADYIEPNRDFEGVDELREMAYSDIEKAIMTGLDYTLEELIERGSMFHPDTVHARNWFLLKKIRNSKI